MPSDRKPSGSDTPDQDTEKEGKQKAGLTSSNEKKGGLVPWLLSGRDEMSIGPTVPARVRVLWGILVLAALVWLIVLVRENIAVNKEVRTRLDHKLVLTEIEGDAEAQEGK